MEPLFVILNGAPRTKKNHGRVIKRGGRKFHIPSEALEEWNTKAQAWLARFRSNYRGELPLTCNVNCAARFWRHANTGDAVGFYQALADALEEGGIVLNDRQIVSWNGSRLLVDKDNPRIEVVIAEVSDETIGSNTGVPH